MVNSDPKTSLLKAIGNLQSRGDVDTVLRLNSVRHTPSLAAEVDYQRAFKGYYFPTPKPAGFYASFFALLGRAASDRGITLEKCLLEVHSATNERHLSFCSKLLATVSDEFVIYDRNVAALLGISTKPLPQNDWINVAMTRYTMVQDRIDEFAASPSGERAIGLFDLAFPQATNLPKRRKADFLLWASYEKPTHPHP